VSGNERRFCEARPTEGFEWIAPVDHDNFELFHTLHAGAPAAAWQAVEMELITTDDAGLPLRRSWMPWLGSHVLILRDDAIEAVGSILSPHGALLPLRCADARLSLFTTNLIPDAIDQAHSQLVRFDSGNILDIVKLSLNGSIVDDVEAFKLAEQPRGSIYLSDRLVARIKATGKTAGAEFAPTGSVHDSCEIQK
jgi:hypothetical protein